MSHPCPMDGCQYAATEWSLCRNHGRDLERNLGDLPALVEELHLTLSRQVALGERVGARGPEKPLAYNVGASAVLGATKAVLVGWVRDLVEDGHGTWPADTHAACARFLLARIGLLRVHPAAAEIAAEVADVHRRAVAIIDRAPVRWFMGQCGNEVEVTTFSDPEQVVLACDRPMYASEGDVQVKCRCGALHLVEDRRKEMALRAREYLLTKVDMLQAIPELMGDAGNLSDARFGMWVVRGKLEAKGISIKGKPTFLVGDVLDLMRKVDTAATRTGDAA